MNWFLVLAGVVLIATAMVDALWTTLSTTGAGPFSLHVVRGLWRLAHRLHRRVGTTSVHLLQLAGPTILVASLLLWVTVLWVGWTLLFSAVPDAVRLTQTDAPASLAGRIYFTGYTLFTLGIGNYVPKQGAWEIVTALASLNGLVLITLSITYLVPILSAATRKHQLAAVVAGLGGTPHEIVERAWQDDGFASFRTHLAQLAPMIEMHARNHLAYPMLHYFHTDNPRTAVSLRLAALDDALLLLANGIAAEARPSAAAIVPVQQAIGGLLSTLHGAYLDPAEEAPPAPSLARLTDAGGPRIDEEAFQRAVRDVSVRRRLMRAYVEDDGWAWSDIEQRPAAPTVPLDENISTTWFRT